VFTKDVRVVQAPQIKGLEVREILSLGRKHIDLDDYLPEYTKGRVPNRSWLCNLRIVNSLIPQEFKQLIDKAMSERQKYIVAKKKFEVQIIPELAEKLKKSQHISSICYIF
jgi:hypothetical protein